VFDMFSKHNYRYSSDYTQYPRFVVVLALLLFFCSFTSASSPFFYLNGFATNSCAGNLVYQEIFNSTCSPTSGWYLSANCSENELTLTYWSDVNCTIFGYTETKNFTDCSQVASPPMQSESYSCMSQTLNTRNTKVDTAYNQNCSGSYAWKTYQTLGYCIEENPGIYEKYECAQNSTLFLYVCVDANCTINCTVTSASQCILDFSSDLYVDTTCIPIPASESGSSGLSTAAIASIVVASVIAVFIIGGLIYYAASRRRQYSQIEQ